MRSLFRRTDGRIAAPGGGGEDPARAGGGGGGGGGRRRGRGGRGGGGRRRKCIKKETSSGVGVRGGGGGGGGRGGGLGASRWGPRRPGVGVPVTRGRGRPAGGFLSPPAAPAAGRRLRVCLHFRMTFYTFCCISRFPVLYSRHKAGRRPSRGSRTSAQRFFVVRRGAKLSHPSEHKPAVPHAIPANSSRKRAGFV